MVPFALIIPALILAATAFAAPSAKPAQVRERQEIGISQDSEQQAQTTSGIVICPSCGLYNNINSPVCTYCHSLLVVQKQAPQMTPIAAGEDDRAYTSTHTRLGIAKNTGQTVDVSDVDRYSGMYVLGRQGTGKSSLLEWLIYQDIANKDTAVIVIDPHGDLVEHVIAQMPERKLAKTFVLDMEDEAYPFGINLFSGKKLATSIAQTQAVDRVMHVFDVLWPDVLSQQGLPRYLRAATITLLRNPGTTLVDMYDFLTDEDSLRENMLGNVSDPTVTQFWQRQYNSKSKSVREKEVSSLINRLEALFMGRSLVRNIVGQSATTIDFRAAIENREIILIKLPLKTLPQDASLIGTMLIAQIHAAIFSFADTKSEERPGFSLFVDEFQHFATPDFAEMFTEGRKFGSRVCFAHQLRSQIPDALKTLKSATINANTVICFQTTDDASEMTYVYPDQETVDVNTMPRDPLDYLLDHSHPEEGVTVFTSYLAAADEIWKNRRQNIQFQHKLSWIPMDEFLKRNDYPEARQVLKELLYDCMRYRRSDYALLPRAVHALLFINGLDEGVEPFVEYKPTGSAAMYISGLSKQPPSKFSASTEFQQLCAAPSTSELERVLAFIKTRLNQKKQDELEKSMDLIFSLRFTMEILAQEPLGERHRTSQLEIKAAIQNLQKREAFVKVGNHRTALKTFDIPESVPAGERTARKEAIVEQTRYKYCTPETQVVQETMQRLEEARKPEPIEVPEPALSLPEPPTQRKSQDQTPAQTPVSMDKLNSLYIQLKAREIDPDTTILAALGEHYMLTIRQWMRLFAWGSYPRATQYFKELREQGWIFRKDREGRGGKLVEGDWFFLLSKGANELLKRKQNMPLFRLEPNEAERASGDTLFHTYLVNEILIHLRLLEQYRPDLFKIESIDHERSMRRQYLAALGTDTKLYPDGFLRFLVPTPNGLKRRYTFLELQHTTQKDEANWKTKCRKYLALFEQINVLEQFFSTRTPLVLVITMNEEYVAYHKQWIEEVLQEIGDRGRAYSNRFLIGAYEIGISDMSMPPAQFFCTPRFYIPFQQAAYSVFDL